MLQKKTVFKGLILGGSFLFNVFMVHTAQAITMNCSGLTFDNVASLKPGSSSQDVRKILCPEQTEDNPMTAKLTQNFKNGKSFTITYETELYMDEENTVSIFYVKTKDGKLTYLGARNIKAAWLPPCQGINEGNFEKVKSGMGLSEINQLLCGGKAPQDLRLSMPDDKIIMTAMYSAGEGGKTISVGFDYDGKSMEIGKSNEFKSSNLKPEWQKFGNP